MPITSHSSLYIMAAWQDEDVESTQYQHAVFYPVRFLEPEPLHMIDDLDSPAREDLGVKVGWRVLNEVSVDPTRLQP